MYVKTKLSINTYIVLDAIDKESKEDQVTNGFGKEERHAANRRSVDKTKKAAKIRCLRENFIALCRAHKRKRFWRQRHLARI